jgi:hypothetical protein
VIRAKPFDPRTIGGLSIWLDAFVAPNDGVWLDKSGSGRNGVQESVNNRPDWVASGINGRPALSFDGINDNFGLPPLALPNWHVFAVCVPTGTKTVIYAGAAGAIPRVLSSTGSGLLTASGAASGTVAPTWVDTRVGASWDGGALKSYYAGFLGELLVFSSSLASGQASAVQAYLTRKWGI